MDSDGKTELVNELWLADGGIDADWRSPPVDFILIKSASAIKTGVAIGSNESPWRMMLYSSRVTAPVLQSTSIVKE